MFEKGKTYVVFGVLNHYIGTADQIHPGDPVQIHDAARGFRDVGGGLPTVGLKGVSIIMAVGHEMASLVCGVFSPRIESYRFPDDTVVWLPLETITAYFEWTGVPMSEIKTQVPESDFKESEPTTPRVH